MRYINDKITKENKITSENLFFKYLMFEKIHEIIILLSNNLSIYWSKG